MHDFLACRVVMADGLKSLMKNIEFPVWMHKFRLGPVRASSTGLGKFDTSYVRGCVRGQHGLEPYLSAAAAAPLIPKPPNPYKAMQHRTTQ